jgi:hypothetical protein
MRCMHHRCNESADFELRSCKHFSASCIPHRIHHGAWDGTRHPRYQDCHTPAIRGLAMAALVTLDLPARPCGSTYRAADLWCYSPTASILGESPAQPQSNNCVAMSAMLPRRGSRVRLLPGRLDNCHRTSTSLTSVWMAKPGTANPIDCRAPLSETPTTI